MEEEIIKIDNPKVNDTKVDIPNVDNHKVDNKYTTKRWLRKLVGETLENLFRLILFWEKDNKSIGKIIRFIHHFVIYIGVISYFLIHIFVPSFFIFLVYYSFWGITWLQHLILGGCVVADVESKLISDNNNGLIYPILNLFNVDITHESADGIVLLSSTLIMCILSCELLSRTIRYMRS
jgi:hypothetical protein